MRRRLRFRPRASQIETLAKRHMWKRMALVGICDADIMGRLVAACRGLSLVIVPQWPAKSDQPGERIKQRAREEKLRKLCGAYDRVTLLEPGAVPDGELDAAVLLDLGDDLADVGAAYAGLVRGGGWLIGDDHRDIGTRAILAAVAPGWERLDDGIWSVRVRREPVDQAVRPDAPDDLEDAGSEDAATPTDGAGSLELEYDPIHSGSDVAGAEGELGIGAPDDPLPGLLGAEESLPSAIGGHSEEPSLVHAGKIGDVLCDQSSPLGSPSHAQFTLANTGVDLHASSDDAPAIIPPKRRGGRPKGSRNKAKVA